MISKKGKKYYQWQEDKKILIKELEESGEYRVIKGKVFGICKDCNKFNQLTPDHIIKRSLGGTNDKSNIDWVCLKCHIQRDQMGDKKNKKQIKSKKAVWEKEHICPNCKHLTSMYLCHNCKLKSFK